MAAVNKDPRDVIIAPVVSEKSYGLIDEGKYTFIVDPRSNKTEIKLAIEKIFGVKVDSVNTLNRVGKHRRIKAQSLMAYRARDDQERREAADELTRLNQEMGLL